MFIERDPGSFRLCRAFADRLGRSVRTSISQCTRTFRSGRADRSCDGSASGASRLALAGRAQRRRRPVNASGQSSSAVPRRQRTRPKGRFGDRGGGHVSGRMEHGGLPCGQTLIERIESFPTNSMARFSSPLPTFPAPARADHSLHQPGT